MGYAFTLQRELDRQVCDPVAAEREQGLHPALQRVVACAQNLTEASGAAIALGTPEAMVCVARSGASAPPEGARMDSRSGLSGECIRTGAPAICVNAAADPRVNFQACRALDVASMVYFPLRSGLGQIIGVLGVFSSRPLHFSQKDISSLRFIEGMVNDALAQNAAEQLSTPFASIKWEEVIQEVPTLSPEPPTPDPQPVAKPSPVPPKMSALAPSVPVPEVRAVARKEVTPEPKPEAIFVGRVVDESVRDVELDIPDLDAAVSVPARRSHIPTILALIIVALIAFAAWNYRGLFRRAEPVAQSAAPKVETPSPTEPITVPAPDPPAAEKILTSEVSLRSQTESATITILLPHEIRAEGYGLINPDRIYFDLHDVKLADAKGKVFKSDEGLIARVRLAQSTGGVTRVVFDLREPATFDSRQEQNPPRLIIEMHRVGIAHQNPPPPTDSTKVTIVIDPGHGGRDLGTVSPEGLREKDLTLDVAQRLGLLLQERLGANVVYTRDKDEFVSLENRAEVANRTQADFLISIHGNSSPLPSVRGVETYYFKVPAAGQNVRTTAAARDLASDIHQGLLSGLAGPQDHQRDRGVRPANFVVLRQAQMPAVLAEISFISNQHDAPRLETAGYREQIAKALYSGIVTHLERTNPKSATVADLAVQRLSGTP